jgi:hypothetical protein
VMMILFQSQGLHFPREDVTEEFNGSWNGCHHGWWCSSFDSRYETRLLIGI